MNHEQIPVENQEAARAPEAQELSAIAEAENFDELYAALDRIGAIRSNGETYAAEYLKSRIDDARRMGEPLPIMMIHITRQGGLREKVAALMEKEKAEKQA